MVKYHKYLPVLLLLLSPLAKASDCEVGVWVGIRDTGTLLHATCGNKWRAIFAKTLTYDGDHNDEYGYFSNRYHYRLGLEYRLILKKFRFDLGMVYIDEKTWKFQQEQYAIWFKVSYPVAPSVNCGWAHQSVPFVDDAGRNQFGCDYSFKF